MRVIKRQEEILKGKGKLRVFPVVRHSGKKEYYRLVNKVIGNIYENKELLT